MSTYLVTLVLETEPGEKRPDRWDWGQVLDTPAPVSVVDCTPITDDPDPLEADRLRYWVTKAHFWVRINATPVPSQGETGESCDHCMCPECCPEGHCPCSTCNEPCTCPMSP